jgi:hypothetical protein
LKKQLDVDEKCYSEDRLLWIIENEYDNQRMLVPLV